VQIAAQRVGGMKAGETHSIAGGAPASTQRSQETGVEELKKAAGKRNRRARGTAPASRSKSSVKRSNGHPRANGHDRASSPGAALHAPDGQGSAASVDASGASAANAAASAAAGADREAYAEAAPAPNGREGFRQARPGGQAEAEPRPRVPGDAHSRNVASDEADSGGAREERPSRPGPGEIPLPDDIADFVDEVHSRIDVFEILSDLLGSKDEKVKQRALEKVLEMKYGRSAESSEEPVQIIMNAPRPQRD